ncbi:hypothetical protein BDN71DRAFT_1507371 [Pleurotus eryngii]|uniref:Uncharacterized protein n=1 Tax=Pleurotus eryngii TaxID=5323 RepID=A0A9P5ZUT1_PLEER|nr:hypothetical protein BDN71DRAFT_1507371 [Pleurotus eryngii]
MGEGEDVNRWKAHRQPYNLSARRVLAALVDRYSSTPDRPSPTRRNLDSIIHHPTYPPSPKQINNPVTNPAMVHATSSSHIRIPEPPKTILSPLSTAATPSTRIPPSTHPVIGGRGTTEPRYAAARTSIPQG